MEPTPPKPPQVVSDPIQPSEIVDASLEVDTPLEDGAHPETTLDLSPKSYYQAIGWLRGKVVKNEERYCVQIRDVDFPLYLPRRVMAVAANLEGQMAWMKCYPQSKGEGLSFKVMWMGTEHNEKCDPGIFVLRGVWQFIPQSRRPVFSIYRNELKNYESRPNNQHLPLIWSDQPPYRFRKDSEERPKFYQITARLIPQRSCFGFVSQLAEPLEQTPKRVKKTPANAPTPERTKYQKGDKTDKADKTGKLDNADKTDQPTTEQPAIADELATTVAVNEPTVETATAVTESPTALVEAVTTEALVNTEPEPTTATPAASPEPAEPKKSAKSTKSTKSAKAAEPTATPVVSAGEETPPVEEADPPKTTKKKTTTASKSKAKSKAN